MYSFSKNTDNLRTPAGGYEVQFLDFKLYGEENDQYILAKTLIRDDVDTNPKEWRGKFHYIKIKQFEYEDPNTYKRYLAFDKIILGGMVNAIPRTNESIDFGDDVNEVIKYLRGAFAFMKLWYAPSKDGTATYPRYAFKPTKYTPKSIASSDDLDDSSLPF